MASSNDPPSHNSNNASVPDGANSDKAKTDETDLPAPAKLNTQIPHSDPRTEPAPANSATDAVPADTSTIPGPDESIVPSPANTNNNLPPPMEPVPEHPPVDTNLLPGSRDARSEFGVDDKDQLPAPTDTGVDPKLADHGGVPATGHPDNIPAQPDQGTDAEPGNPTHPRLPRNPGPKPAPNHPSLKRVRSAPAGPPRSSRPFPFPPKLTPLPTAPLAHPTPLPRPSTLQRFRNSSAFESAYVTTTKDTIRAELKELVLFGPPAAITQQLAARNALLSMLGRAEWAGISASWVATHLGKVAQRRKAPEVSNAQKMADVQFWEDMWVEVRDRRARVLAGETEEVRQEETTAPPATKLGVGSTTVRKSRSANRNIASSGTQDVTRQRTSEEEAVAAVEDFEDGYNAMSNAGAPGATGFPTAAEQIAHVNATRRPWYRDGFFLRLFRRRHQV